MKREVARDNLYKIIFQKEFHDDFLEIYPRLVEECNPGETQGEYILSSIKGIIDNEEDIILHIKKYLKGWNFDRLSKQVLACLKLGVYETMFNEDIPIKVALSESVTLAHAYCDDKEASFVNGLLHNIYVEAKEKEEAKYNG